MTKIKRTRIFWFSFFLALFVAGDVIIYAESFKAGAKLRVKTSTTYMKDKPKPFGGKVIKVLDRGAQVSFVEAVTSWFKVNYENTKGYIPLKSLIESKKFSSFSKAKNVSQSDMAAATKGFSPEVEKKNRKNKNLNYKLLDKAEKQTTVKNPFKETTAFRENGKLGEFQ